MIYDENKHKVDNWLILLEHGVLWWGDSLDKFESFLTETLGLQAENS